MAVIDVRKKSEAEQSFYVVDDLRYAQNQNRPNRGTFDIFRFDSLAEAINKFKEIPEDMTPAIGMHLSERSELDLIHRREGEAVLVTDYLNFPQWRTNSHVLSAVSELSEALKVEWQMNSKLIGETILIPLHSFDRIPDKVFDDKNLAAKTPPIYSDNLNPISAINEVFAEKHGWMPFQDAKKTAEQFGYHNPELLKVQRFNVNYIDNRGNRGQADISALDLEILKERHAILFGNDKVRSAALYKLAEELDEFAFDFDLYDYKDNIEDREGHVKNLFMDLSSGDTKEIVSYLHDMEEERIIDPDLAEKVSDQELAHALSLASRIQGVTVLERKPSLDSQIKGATEKAAQNDVTTAKEGPALASENEPTR